MINYYGIRYIFGRTFPIPADSYFSLGLKSWRLAITGIDCQSLEKSPYGLEIDWGHSSSPHLSKTATCDATIPQGYNAVPALIGGVFSGHHNTIVGNDTQDQSTTLSVVDHGCGVSIHSGDFCFKNNASWRPLGQSEEWHRPWIKLAWEPTQGFPYHVPKAYNHYYGDPTDTEEDPNVRCWAWLTENNRWRASTMPVGNVVIYSEPSGGLDKGLILGYSYFYRPLQLRPQESVCINYNSWIGSEYCTNKFLSRLIAYALDGTNANHYGSGWTLRLCKSAPNPKSTYEDVVEIAGEGYAAKTISSWSVDTDTLIGVIAGSFGNTSVDTNWETITHVVVTCNYADDVPAQEGIGNPAFWFELPTPRTLSPGDTLSFPNGVKLRLDQE